MYIYCLWTIDVYLLFMTASDCVWVCGNVCCIAAVVEIVCF